MKKKILALCLVVVLAVTAVTGATLAYFTDTEKATNVMTVGNVNINLEEYTKDENGNKLPFSKDNAIPLYPMSDDQGQNLGNKIVDVYNDSPNEAYIRVIAIFDDTDGFGVGANYLSANFGEDIVGVKPNTYNNMVINGKEYDVIVYDALKAVPAGAKVQALNSVWLKTDATNELIKKELTDGTLDIQIIAQGTQVEGFKDYAEAMKLSFGEITGDNLHKWMTGTENDGIYKAVINDHA